MPVQDNFRINLNSVLDRAGLSQNQLAEATGISRPYINKVLLGSTTPSIAYCEKLAAGVKTPLAYLILEPKTFERIAAESHGRVSDPELLTRELTTESPKPPAVRRDRARVKPKTAQENRLNLWVERLLQGKTA